MSTITMAPALDVQAIDEALAAGKTLPTDWYHNRDLFDFETDQIFGRSWHLAGPLEKLEEVGDRIVMRAGNVPVVIVRDKDGVLRGFVNACRHRGYQLADGSGRRKLFQCLYHGWTYELTGELRATPQCAVSDFSTADLSLIPVSVDTWNRLVFVNPDPTAGSLLDSFPELLSVAQELHIDPVDYTYEGEDVTEISGNWKGWCENSVECYHCPTVHKGSYDQAFISLHGGTRYVTTENLIGAHAEVREAYLPEHLDEQRGSGLGYFYLFPGSFVIQDDYTFIAGYTVPQAPELTQFVTHTWRRNGVSDDDLANWRRMWGQTFAEDAEAVRIQAVGYRSRRLPFGQLSRTADGTILKFHELVWRHYRAALAAGR